MKSAILPLLLGLAGAVAPGSTLRVAALEYPGPAPGPIELAVRDRETVLGNRAFSASWKLGDRGLKPGTIHDLAGGRSLVLTGEVFRIVLADGRKYAASTLLREGPPVRVELTPRPQAARWAERLAGRQVDVPLRSEDGALRVVWRGLARDEANAMRQELDITPAAADVTIHEIVWLHEVVPGAQRPMRWKRVGAKCEKGQYVGPAATRKGVSRRSSSSPQRPRLMYRLDRYPWHGSKAAYCSSA